MNDTTTPAEATQYTEFVWRRLDEPLRIFGKDLPWQLWLVILGLALAAAAFYVVWMYIKDSRAVGPWWASLLGFLRCCVYAILAVVFLLPSRQTHLETRSRAKVLVAFDFSGSMHTSDDPVNVRPKDRVTRAQRVLDFLFGPDNFPAELEKKNPTTYYRFASRLDEQFFEGRDGRVWTRQEKEDPARDEEGRIVLPPARPLTRDYWEAWLNVEGKVKFNDEDNTRLKVLQKLNEQLKKDGVHRGTNVNDSLLTIVNRELNNRLQGIVVFTDGRSTESSVRGFQELAGRSKAAHIPIFVVALGEDRLRVKQEIVDVRMPARVQPEDKFRVVVEVVGHGLADKALDFSMDLVHVRKDKKEKEEKLDIKLIEAEDKENPKKPEEREQISLGTDLVIRPPSPVSYDKSTPPRAVIEMQLDAAALAQAAGIDLQSDKYRGKKWEIKETTEDSEFQFRAKAPVDKREGLLKKFHLSDKVPLKVIKKPTRVLLFASAATRDYQFVQTLLAREVEKKRVELAIHLQLPPGEIKARTGIVQSVPPERLIKAFPDTLGTKKDLFDLASYDVIVCFDPDWQRLTAEQIRMLRAWAAKGGGLVYVGGHFNTVKLVFPPDEEDPGKYQPLLELLPVVLGDRRDYLSRRTDMPWGLDLEEASPEMEFLRLDEEMDESRFKEDWRAFFYGEGKDASDRPQRGFYNFYPVKTVKQGSVVAARLTDPSVKISDGREQKLHPLIVLKPDTAERVVWIGSTETWRLRDYREAYHERFWTKLIRYAAAHSQGSFAKRIRLEMSTTFTAMRNVEVDAKIDGTDGQPLPDDAKVRIDLKLPPGVPEKEVKKPIVMTRRAGSPKGWFAGKFLVRSPGEYELKVDVMDTADPKGQTVADSETRKFVVKPSDPEMDDTRPDFAALYRLASEADEVLNRIPNASDKAEVKKNLRRPKPAGQESESAKADELKDDKARLFFDLGNAKLIPKCMVADVTKQTSRGQPDDLWNGDFVDLFAWLRGETLVGRKPEDKKFSVVLAVCVLLLSLEWLIRKLLRLA
jgi:hypothetical protein